LDKSDLGLRICEVLGLKWEDYDPAAKTLSIQRSAVDGVVGDVKSEASRDVIPLSDNFAVLLDRWQMNAPPSEDGWVFPSVVTGRPYHAGALLRHHLRPLAKMMGFRGWVGIPSGTRFVVGSMPLELRSAYSRE
jgi:integrase